MHKREWADGTIATESDVRRVLLAVLECDDVCAVPPAKVREAETRSVAGHTDVEGRDTYQPEKGPWGTPSFRIRMRAPALYTLKPRALRMCRKKTVVSIQ